MSLQHRLRALAPMFARGRGDEAETDPLRHLSHAMREDPHAAALLVVLANRLDDLAAPYADVDLTLFAIEGDREAADLAARISQRLTELPKSPQLREGPALREIHA